MLGCTVSGRVLRPRGVMPFLLLSTYFPPQGVGEGRQGREGRTASTTLTSRKQAAPCLVVKSMNPPLNHLGLRQARLAFQEIHSDLREKWSPGDQHGTTKGVAWVSAGEPGTWREGVGS